MGIDPQSSISATSYDGTMRIGGMVGRVVPSVNNQNGYTRWHFDHKRPCGALERWNAAPVG